MSNANLTGLSIGEFDELTLPQIVSEILVTDSNGTVTSVPDASGVLHSDGSNSYSFSKITHDDIDFSLSPNLVVVSNLTGEITTANTTTTEVNYVSGVTSGIQSQLDSKASTSYVDAADTSLQSQINTKANDSAVVHNTGDESVNGIKTFTGSINMSALIPAKVAIIDSIGEINSSSVTPTELSSLENIVDNVQDQLDSKASTTYVDSQDAVLAGDIALRATITYVNNQDAILQTDINTRALNSAVVHNTGAENVGGVKNFTAAPTFTYPTPSMVAYFTPTNQLTSTSISITKLNYLTDVTSNIQAQLNNKATDSLAVHLAGTETITGPKTFSNDPTTFNNIKFSNINGNISTANTNTSMIKIFVAPAGGGTPVETTRFNNTEMEILTGYNLKLSNLTASKAAYLDSSNRIQSSVTTPTELSYVSGVTSAIQTQLNNKAADSNAVHLTGSETITGQKTISGVNFVLQKDSSNVYFQTDQANKRIKMYNKIITDRSLIVLSPLSYWLPSLYTFFEGLWNTTQTLNPNTNDWGSHHMPLPNNSEIINISYSSEATSQTPTAFEFKLEEYNTSMTLINTYYFVFSSPSKLTGTNVYANASNLLYQSDKSTLTSGTLTKGNIFWLYGRANGVNSADKFNVYVRLMLAISNDWN